MNSLIREAELTDDPKASLFSLSRIQSNILASSERRLLTWICSKLPVWISPDLLTITGVGGALLMFLAYVASGWGSGWLWLVVIGCVINWFGDSLDGSLARYRKIERPSFGYFIDHSCDALATLLVMAGLGLSPFVRLDVALFALAGYLLICIHTFLAARVLSEMKLSHIGAGPTEMRLILIGLTVAMITLDGGPGKLGPTSGFDLFVGCVGAVLVLLFCFQTFVTGRRLAAQGSGVDANVRAGVRTML